MAPAPYSNEEQRCLRFVIGGLLSPSEALLLATSSSALGLDVAAAVLFVHPVAPELAAAAAAAIASSVLLNGCILLAGAAAADTDVSQADSLCSNSPMTEGGNPPAASDVSCSQTPAGGSCRTRENGLRSLRMLMISLSGLVHPAAAHRHVAGTFAYSTRPAGVIDSAWRRCCRMVRRRPPLGIVMMTGAAVRAVPILTVFIVGLCLDEVVC